MSMVPKNDNARPPGFSHRTLIPRLLLGLAVVALPDVAPAGIFDFLKRDRDVEIIETHHASNCRCRPRCSHPVPTPKQQATPQTTYRPTPQPAPQQYTATQPTLPYAARTNTVPPITTYTTPPAPALRSAPPAPPVSTPPPARYATRPTPGIVYQPAPVYQASPSVIYQREMVLNHVPVTTWQTQWVDQGGYRMVWVSRPALRRVPRTSYRTVLGYRVVPYQRVAPTAIGLSAPAASLPGQQPSGSLVPDPLEARPVGSQRSVSRPLKPTTAHRVWQARGRFGR